MTVQRARAAPINVLSRWYAVALAMLFALMVAGCATGPKIVDHAFGFDAVNESKGFEVLAYSYAWNGRTIVGGEIAVRQFGSAHQGTGINGPMPLGNSLFVKWRNKTTGETYEDTVDLGALLPRDMTRQRIYFLVADSKLYIYLKDMKRRADPSAPIVGPFKSQYFVTRQIYPRRP